MPNIFIDPVLVMAPSEQSNKAEVEKWFNSLILWLKEATTPFYDWYYSVNAIYSLVKIGRYPFNLNVLASRNGIEFDDTTTAIMTRKLIQLFNGENQELKTQDIDQRFEEINDTVVFQQDSTQIAPPEFTLRWPVPLQSEMLELFGKLCVYKFAGDDFVKNLIVATSPLPQTQDKQIEVATIVRSAIGSPKLEELENSPLIENFPLLFTPDDLPILDVLGLWAQGEAGIRKAIRQQYQQQRQKEDADLFEYYIGKDFITEVEAVSLHTDAKILRTMINRMTVVLTDKAKDLGVELEHLRESKGANSPQRTKDGAGAWRLRITTKGAGWRLHYWRKGDVIEFSNVVKESGDEIFGPYFL